MGVNRRSIEVTAFGRKVNVVAEDIEIDFEGQKKIVTMRRLFHGEISEIASQSMEVKFIGSVPQTKLDQIKMQDLGLLKSLVTAPFSIDMPSIQLLEQYIAQMLIDEFNILNEQEPKKNS